MDLPEIPEVFLQWCWSMESCPLLFPLELIGALPRMINPPHKPLSSLPRLIPVSEIEVKMMG